MGELSAATWHRLAFAAWILLMPVTTLGQNDISLRAAIDAATQRAPEASAASAAVRAADTSLDIARKRPNPSLDLESENFNGTSPFSGSRLRESTALLALPLEIGGKRGARMDVAKAEQSVAAAQTGATQADIVAATTEAFVRLVEAERRAELARQRLALADQAFNAGQVRVLAGKASPLEEQRAKVELTNARVEAEAGERRVDNARQNLERWTGLQISSASAPWLDALVAPEEVSSGAPTLARADAELSAARARTALAQRGRVPDLTLSAGMRRFHETNDNAMVVALSVPLPVLNSGAAEVRRARAEEDRAQALRDAAHLTFERDLAGARLDIEDARATAEAATGPTLTAAAEAARIARIGYREGKLSFARPTEFMQSPSPVRLSHG